MGYRPRQDIYGLLNGRPVVMPEDIYYRLSRKERKEMLVLAREDLEAYCLEMADVFGYIPLITRRIWF